MKEGIERSMVQWAGTRGSSFSYLFPLCLTTSVCACLCHSSTWLLLHTLRLSSCSTPRIRWTGFPTAARLIGCIPGTENGLGYIHANVLHWQPFRQRIIFRIATQVWRCLLGLAPTYLQDLCRPTLGTRGRSSVRSMERGSSLSLLPLLSQGRPVHSRWLSLSCGMDFRWRSDCHPGFFSTHSPLSWKLFFLAAQRPRSLLSSNLEEAQYKSP